MKRVATVAAAVLGSACAAAIAVEVYSVNVVGFSKVDIPPNGKFVLCSVGFDDLADPDIQSVLGSELTGGFGLGDSDVCYVWSKTGQSYDILYKFDSGGFVPQNDGKWVYASNAAIVAQVDLLPGDAFWLVNNQTSTQTVTFKGEVVAVDTNIVSLVPGFNFMSYPYSAEQALNSSSLKDDGADSGFGIGDSDNIYAWDVANQQYKIYYLFDSGGFVPAKDGKWIDAQTTAVISNNLELTRGYWYVRNVGSTLQWTVVRPYNL